MLCAAIASCCPQARLAQPCPQGTYKAVLSNSNSCIRCPPGSITHGIKSTAASSCSVALPGYQVTWLDEDTPQPQPCPLNTYSTGYSTAACRPCPHNLLTPSTGSNSAADCSSAPWTWLLLLFRTPRGHRGRQHRHAAAAGRLLCAGMSCRQLQSWLGLAGLHLLWREFPGPSISHVSTAVLHTRRMGCSTIMEPEWCLGGKKVHARDVWCQPACHGQHTQAALSGVLWFLVLVGVVKATRVPLAMRGAPGQNGRA